jgi:hypothetical protein
VLAVAPCPEDLFVSKLARLDPKDREFVATYHAARPLDLPLIERRLRESGLEVEVVARAVAYLRTLTQRDI